MAARRYKPTRLEPSKGSVYQPAMFFSKSVTAYEREGFRLKKKTLLKRLTLPLLVVAALFLALMGYRYYNLYRFHLEKQTRFMMDTYVTIYAIGPKSVTVSAINSALNRMQAVDAKFNSQNPENAIYTFNHEGIPITDQEILDVTQLALQIARDSDGAFDITVAPLIELWGFYDKSPHLPTQQEISDCLGKVGYQYLILKDGKLQKSKEDVMIDLGGIAKGYAVKEAARVLQKAGVNSALIDAGGDVHALGKKGRDLWKVGLRNPRGNDILGYVEVEDLAVMGSGDYERFFFKNDVRYHHIFNPKTGYPVQGVSSTTLLHPDPMVADAWNTAVFVLGPDEGLKLAEKITEMEVIMVTPSGEVTYTSGLKNALHAVKEVK